MPTGLTSQEVIERRARGLGNRLPARTSRSYAQILAQNLFTFVNNVLFGLGIALVLLGRASDAIVSVLVILINVIVSVVQEIRAKQTLDRIAVLTRPKATVLRAGQEQNVDPDDLVVGDLLCLRPGDQAVVDGAVLEGTLQADESLLTGESDLIPKKAGDPIYSGSFCVSGSALYEAQKVGRDSLAHQLTDGARAFRRVLTPLQQQINVVIRVILALAIWMMVLLAVRTVIDGIPLVESVKMSVVIIGLVPNGLFLAISVAYALGAVRIAGKGALVQQANAVESLSNVDILCLDKTGTLTSNRICFHSLKDLTEKGNLASLLGDFAASVSASNRTNTALLEACPGQKHPVQAETPFSSAREYSALVFDEGTYALGAPEAFHLEEAALNEQILAWADEGLRVLVFAGSPRQLPLNGTDGEPRLPEGLAILGLVALNDELRPEAGDTLQAFARAGVHLKIISGDNPRTVAALARQAGFPAGAKLISGHDLASLAPDEFAAAAQKGDIFGRIVPQQKEQLVQALKDAGHYVGMIGDGVNDVLSLKRANLGIAMQSGSQAARSVADIILLNDNFGALPPSVMEGQRIINGMQDILKLFLARVLYVALLILSLAILGGFPFAPKNISILTLFTVGLPTLALAAWARPGVVRRDVLTRDLLHFVLPASLSVALGGLAVFLGYFIPAYFTAAAQTASQGIESLFQALTLPQSALTHFTLLCGLMLIVFAEPPFPFLEGGDYLTSDRRPLWMALGLLAVYVIVLLVPPLRQFFDLAALQPLDHLLLTAVALLWALVVRWAWRGKWISRFLDADLGPTS